MAFTINYEGDGGEEILDLALKTAARAQYIVELDVLTGDRRTSETADYVVVGFDGNDVLVNQYHEVDADYPDRVLLCEANRRIPATDIVGIKIY